MKKLILLMSVLSFGCPTATEKSSNNISINNGNNQNNQNNQGDAGNNQNNISDVGMNLDFGVDPEGPQFVDVAVNPDRITEAESFSVLVQVTDPQGFDDIGGGRLLTTGGDVLGNFQGSGGSYSIDVNWFDVNSVEALTFPDEVSRTFVVEFFDAGSHVSTAPIDVAFHCNGSPACDGVCGDELCDNVCQNEFNDDMNCGSCGNPCVGGETCVFEQCELPNFLDRCNSSNDCIVPNNGFGDCLDTGDGSRCVVMCQPGGTECGNDACVNVGDPNQTITVCLQDCTNNAGRCTDGLTCQQAGGGVSVCAPPAPG